MNKLEAARKEIDAIDREMAQLFVRRMEAVLQVAEYKKEHMLPLFDAAREEQVIAKNVKEVESELLRPHYVSFLHAVMDVSKQYQSCLLQGLKVAYSGVEGAFAHIAASRIFPKAQKISYPDFPSTYAAVKNGECDCCVLPIENSYAGEVGQVIDLMYESELCVNGIYILPIKQCLLGLAGVEINEIKTVRSHPQALSQCNDYIRKHHLEEVYAPNTAVAAQTVAQMQDRSVAAIASEETAALYGLSVLDHDINDDTMNTTRFAVFSRVNSQEVARQNDSFILLFTVRHQSGALSRAIDVISKYNFNMKVLRSRPVKGQAWHYYFYVEVEGEQDTENGRAMLAELAKQCSMLKVIGHFSSDVILQKKEKQI